MIKVIVTLEFFCNSNGADSRGDAEWEARHFIQEHIMDDEEQCPIEFKTFLLTPL